MSLQCHTLRQTFHFHVVKSNSEVLINSPLTTNFLTKQKRRSLAVDGCALVILGHGMHKEGLSLSTDSKSILKYSCDNESIFKLAQGEYVAPEKIEVTFLPWARTLVGQVYADLSLLCKDPAVIKGLLDSITKFGKENGLKGFELVRGIVLDTEGFTIENGLLTPTFKLKRADAKQKYGEEIKGMYSVINQVA